MSTSRPLKATEVIMHCGQFLIVKNNCAIHLNDVLSNNYSFSSSLVRGVVKGSPMSRMVHSLIMAPPDFMCACKELNRRFSVLI